ncbi:T9SS type A sorting domain-containing protein [Aequorivita sp. F47161]|uniref:T9SS type A sorting domain-containing protein n=1 Tax=Aequorivita vitellina TaxID=2874475 RepID=A0A9X1QUT3_9FLAO|nr:T9SS type A sorting domain-containing protein [Aequorivita vitellina]MCG2417847.1 T9SS type A sorting domain-containing protein [Aequorivita vitellina]MCZ4318346.1 T9SS type A sorting domain-containing protein [Aequorivita viscosa]
MKKITLFFCFFTISILSAQNVVEIAWEQGINESVASPTIEVGDTVLWTWADASSKSVTSLPGGSEEFDSGNLKDLNNEFAYTFLKTGITDYKNDQNPLMRGKVTVVNKLSAEDKFVKNLNFYPNPVKNNLTISSIFKIDSYQVYNVLGTLVSEGKGSGNTTQVDMSRLNSGLYFVKVISKNMQTTLKIAKK